MPTTVIRACLLPALAAWAFAGLPEATACETVDAARLDALVGQLGDEEFDVREAAQSELEGLEPSHLERLRAIYAKSEDLEVRTRLRTAILQVASKIEFEPDRLLEAARKAIREKDQAEARALLGEMLALLRFHWIQNPHPEGVRGYFYPSSRHDPLIKLCTALSECREDTLLAILMLLFENKERQPQNKVSIEKVYDLRDICYRELGEDDPLHYASELLCGEFKSTGLLRQQILGRGVFVLFAQQTFQDLFAEIVEDIRNARRRP